MIVRPPVSHIFAVLSSLTSDRAARMDHIMREFASGAIPCPSHFVIHHQRCRIVRKLLDATSEECSCVPAMLPMGFTA